MDGDRQLPNDALILGVRELRPIARSSGAMSAAIGVVERATVTHYQGQVREHLLVDPGGSGEAPRPLQIEFAADDTLGSGFHVFPERPAAGTVPPPNMRFIGLLDRETRQLLALLDYQALNPLRVGACGGLACRYLAPPDARTAAILGSGIQARTQLEAIQQTVSGLERARVYSPTPGHRDAYARELSESLDLPVDAVETAEDAVRGADIVSLASNSRSGPSLDLAWLRPGALVISMTAGQIPATAIGGARVVTATWDQLATREPYSRALADGRDVRQAWIGPLGALILGEVASRRSTEEVVVFELTAFNVWSVAVSFWAYEQAVERGIGFPFSLSDEDGR